MREMDLTAKEKGVRKDFKALVTELMGTAKGRTAFGELVKTEPLVVRGELGRWCMLCPSGATFECCTPQKTPQADVGRERALAKGKGKQAPCGCGLKLCWACSALLGGMFQGDLGKLLAKFGLRDPPAKFYPRGLRADADFLVRDGLLVRQVARGSSQ